MLFTPNHAKYFLKVLPVTISISWLILMSKLFTIQKLQSKMYFVWCANTHHDVITFEVNGEV